MKIYHIDNYLSELDSNLFFRHKKYTSLINSPTGTGKTETIFDRARTQEKVIVAFPYTSQVIQQAKKNPGFQCLYDDAQYSTEKTQRIICTYDKLVTLINHDVNLNEYELHLDECHNLYVAADYRDRVMYYIASSIRQRAYQQVFCYSSTYDSKYLSNYLVIDQHFRIQKNLPVRDDVTCVHLNNQKITLNESLYDYIQKNVSADEKILIYRNNKSENTALADLLEDAGISTTLVDSDCKNEQETIELLENEMLSKQTKVLITTSMLTEGINLLNNNITQIHYIDKSKSAATIRQFASRARNSTHKTFVWYKKDETLHVKKDIFEEWIDFIETSGRLEKNYNSLVADTPDHLKHKHINHLLRGSSMYDRTWRQKGFRNVSGEIKIDYTRIANYFYELDVTNQSHNSYILGEELEKYDFDVYYINYDTSNIDQSDIDSSKEKSRTVRAIRKAERLEILEGYRDDQIDVRKRLNVLLRKKGKTANENREIKIAKEWIALKKSNVAEDDIIQIIRKNNTNKAKFRLSLKEQQKNDLLYSELSSLIHLNQRYDVTERSNLLVIAEKNIRDKHSIELNIRKTKNNEIHGKISKGIFNTLFNTESHVYSGKHSISVTNFDPLFFKTTN